MEKARTNMYTPHESEEMSISINRLYVENRRLVNLIQRLTKDSEEHAKSWYADYNIRNYDLFSASTLSAPDNFAQINDTNHNVRNQNVWKLTFLNLHFLKINTSIDKTQFIAGGLDCTNRKLLHHLLLKCLWTLREIFQSSVQRWRALTISGISTRVKVKISRRSFKYFHTNFEIKLQFVFQD